MSRSRLHAIRWLERQVALLAVVMVVAVVACSGGASSTGGPSAASGGSPRNPLVGAWATTITRNDLTAAGITEVGLLNENSGKFTWTFAPDGTWTSTQESLDAAPIYSPVFRGTYTVDGSSLVAVTTFPEQYRDSGLHYTFTIDGSSVRFDVLDAPDTILPVIVEAHPWTRAQ